MKRCRRLLFLGVSFINSYIGCLVIFCAQCASSNKATEAPATPQIERSPAAQHEVSSSFVEALGPATLANSTPPRFATSAVNQSLSCHFLFARFLRVAEWKKLMPADLVRLKDLQMLYQSNEGMARFASSVNLNLAVAHNSPDYKSMAQSTLGTSYHGKFIPASSVPTGDLFGAFAVDERRVALYVGDVAGHGPPAAAQGVKIQKEIFGLAAHGDTSATALAKEANPLTLMKEIEKRYPDTSLNTTLAFMYFDRVSGEVELANAAHVPIYVRRADGHLDEIFHPGYYLSRDSDLNYRSMEPSLARFNLEKGDTLIVFSDGFTEGHFLATGRSTQQALTQAVQTKSRYLGPELEGIFRSSGDAGALSSALLRSVKSRDDDVSVMILKR